MIRSEADVGPEMGPETDTGFPRPLVFHVPGVQKNAYCFTYRWNKRCLSFANGVHEHLGIEYTCGA